MSSTGCRFASPKTRASSVSSMRCRCCCGDELERRVAPLWKIKMQEGGQQGEALLAIEPGLLYEGLQAGYLLRYRRVAVA